MELYIHFPFCKRKCRYCDFASYAGCEDEMSAYVDIVLLEARHEAEAYALPVQTVFLGGGTPSLLPASLLDKLLCGIGTFFPLVHGAEFTSEANPGTVTVPWLDTGAKHGVNRLSLGMQAFQPTLLRMLGRIHDFPQVEASVKLAREAGIVDINLDLMFGLPGQTLAQWQETLDAALSLAPSHLSCYGLIPEEGTPLKADLDAGRLALPDEATERQMYDNAITFPAKHGFTQYEISNFALPGHECRHNLGYWRQVPYLGLGASASSMLPDSTGQAVWLRKTNPSGLHDYMSMVKSEAWSLRECYPVNRADAMFETMMLGLRTTKGVSEQNFQAMHGISMEEKYGAKLHIFAKKGLLSHAQGRWFLTRRGMDIQNSILVELMDN